MIFNLRATPKKLTDCWIAITRPAHQAGSLTQTLQAEGANIIPFPLLEIIPPTAVSLLQAQTSNLASYDLAIFISPNAVEKALQFVDKESLSHLKIAAVGKKTALCLANQGLSVDYFPDDIFNSEALLSLDEMQQVKGQNIAIFRGEGGRDLLRDTLQQRGARVDYLNVYARRCPMSDIEVLKQHYQQGKLDIIILTSGESFAHLLRLAKDEQWLSQVILLLGSERIKQKFKDKFSGEIWVAPDPSDETIYKILRARCV
ncbi:MAG TPA: uroporphyrinogen-III synthase [Leucothrix mucor]|nr:uroporphyrinogen-III synthase [Leucothrix mucor]